MVDYRLLEQDLPALSAAAADLVRLNANVLLTDGTETALQAAISASQTLPIIMIATNFDPFAGGYVKGLARPGGNITGLFLRQTELAEKQTELLLEAVPGAVRLGVLWDSTIPIVFLSVTDPMGQGLVSSLSHPGGNTKRTRRSPQQTSAFGG